jgi:hypothetical protein
MLVFCLQPDLHVALDTWALETVRSLGSVFLIALFPMSEPLTLSLGQKFEMERMSRAIDSTVDIQTLQGLAKQLLQAWHSQKAATQWMMRQQLDSPPRVAQELALRPDVIQSLRPGTPQPSFDVL